MTSDAASYWDSQAADFDAEPDHGLRDPTVRRAWRTLLGELLPAPPQRVADLGSGTGSLAVLLAEQGHRVTGLDLAPAMVAEARVKASRHGLDVQFAVGDASAPDLPLAAFDVVLSRHVVWALPDPRESLRLWTDLLAPGGRLVLVEGYWFTDAGLHADDLVALLDPRVRVTTVRTLDDATLWGKDVTDERYAVVAELS
jgi:SAM-dependent methyltransferase